ncbi:LD-carboxypeptidase [Candidatus Micrarchaeota archaeon]|nr:LD-carboxypeptidase [Candidatus Micrarchaeota archaeon]
MIARRLRKGDTIEFVTPSRRVVPEKKKQFDSAIQYFRSLGLKTRLGKHALTSDRFGVSSGTPEERADDINRAFTDTDVSAVWSIHGGETANELLELVDYKAIKKNPKVFMGMSDMDVLTLAVHEKTGLVTFNSPDPKIAPDYQFGLDYTRQAFVERMMQASKEIRPASAWKTIRRGRASGKLLGCNLSSILKLAGTEWFPDFDGAVLFLEAYKLGQKFAVYKLQQLEHLGVLDKLAGIVVGNNHEFGFGDQTAHPGVTFEDILLAKTADYEFPILKIGEFGHYCPHAFPPIGANVSVDATNKKLSITSEFLR